jgi:acyl-CoA dehydrogenase
MLNFSLSTEQLALQKKAREFALKEVLPLAWQFDQRDDTPLELLHKADAAGLMNTDIPKKYGGQGLGCLDAVIITEELAAACPGISTSIVDNSLGMEPLILSTNDGICAFIVEKTWEGVSAGRPIPKLGQRTSNTTAINLKNVRVPAENMLASPGEGFVLAMQTFARTRPAIGAFAMGTARSAMEFAIDHAKKRKAFGSKISDFQANQFKLAEMYQKIETSRLLVWKAAWEADVGIDPNVNASIAKMYASEAANEVVDQALQIMAGYGYTRFFPVEKLLRDVRLYRIYEGTSEVQRLILAGHVLSAYESIMPPLEELPVENESDWPNTTGKEQGASTWRCRICGYVHRSEDPPEECPYCFFPGSAFKYIE